MAPLILIFGPILLFIIISGLVMLVKGLGKNDRFSIQMGGLMAASPFILYALAAFVGSFAHRKYIGTYTSATKKGHLVTLELKSYKQFELKMEQCDQVLKGTWETVQYDDLRLELSEETGIGLPSADLREDKIYFSGSINTGCGQEDILDLERVRSSN